MLRLHQHSNRMALNKMNLPDCTLSSASLLGPGPTPRLPGIRVFNLAFLFALVAMLTIPPLNVSQIDDRREGAMHRTVGNGEAVH